MGYCVPPLPGLRKFPNETCEFPSEMPGVGSKCLLFVAYARHEDEVAGSFGLLAVIEVFRSEMEFARKNGGEALLAKLKAAGHYPFSDLDRSAVA